MCPLLGFGSRFRFSFRIHIGRIYHVKRADDTEKLLFHEHPSHVLLHGDGEDHKHPVVGFDDRVRLR